MYTKYISGVCMYSVYVHMCVCVYDCRQSIQVEAQGHSWVLVLELHLCLRQLFSLFASACTKLTDLLPPPFCHRRAAVTDKGTHGWLSLGFWEVTLTTDLLTK